MKILPNAVASSFIHARCRPADVSWSEHFAATLFQYLKDVHRIPQGRCLMVDDHFQVESNWEDEVLKQAGRSEGRPTDKVTQNRRIGNALMAAEIL